MRRWFKFGVDTVVGQEFIETAGDDWTDFRPVFYSMQHKANWLTILQKSAGNRVATEAIYVQNAFLDSGYTPPAADCSANHLPPGYSMIGGLSPLLVFLQNGFLDRNFQSTPPIVLVSYTEPSQFGG